MNTDEHRWGRAWCPHRAALGATGIRGALRTARPTSSRFIRVHLCSSVAFLVLSFSTCALEISWTNNLLTVTGSNLPGGKLDVWYLEAFCRSGAHNRDWRQTTLPHKTTLLTNENNRVLRFHTLVQTNV